MNEWSWALSRIRKLESLEHRGWKQEPSGIGTLGLKDFSLEHRGLGTGKYLRGGRSGLRRSKVRAGLGGEDWMVGAKGSVMVKV